MNADPTTTTGADRAIAYPDVDTLPAALQQTLTSRGSTNVYRMVTHSPCLAPAFLTMADAVLRNNSLPADLRELAIVRVGHTYAAAYEIHHHERIARVCGLSERALDAARTGDTTGLADTERSILAWTDTLLAEHRLDGDDRAAALAALGVEQLTDLVLTVGFYQLVCNFLNTFDVTTDGETPPRPPGATN